MFGWWRGSSSFRANLKISDFGLILDQTEFHCNTIYRYLRMFMGRHLKNDNVVRRGPLRSPYKSQCDWSTCCCMLLSLSRHVVAMFLLRRVGVVVSLPLV